MISAQRRILIAEELDQSGHAAVRDLASRLGVSEMTIRRDLDALERRGDVVRIHGGALTRRRATAFEPMWDAKLALRHEAKLRIGRAAAELVDRGETILIDSGTTTLAVACAISVPCRVVVVDAKIAIELASRPTTDGIETIIVGGSVRNGYFSTTGTFALEMLSQLHVDRAFLGADAIDPVEGITNATVEEVAVKRQIIAAARETILVADGSKVGRVALAKVARLSEIGTWMTDVGVDLDSVDAIRAVGVHVTVV